MATQWMFRAGEPYGFHEAPRKTRKWSVATGVWNTVITYTGPVDRLSDFVASLTNAQEVDVDEDGDVAVVRVGYPIEGVDNNAPPLALPDPYFRAWTLTGNFHQVPLISAPHFLSFSHKLIADILSQVKLWKRAVSESDGFDSAELDFQAYSDEVAEYVAAATNNVPDPLRQQMIESGTNLFENLAVDSDQFEIVQPVIRKVDIVTTVSQVNADVSNVGRFYTWPALKAAEPTLDQAVIIGVQKLEEMNTSATFYWQKRVPTVDVQADGKRQVTLEYWAWEGYDQWRYKAPIT